MKRRLPARRSLAVPISASGATGPTSAFVARASNPFAHVFFVFPPRLVQGARKKPIGHGGVWIQLHLLSAQWLVFGGELNADNQRQTGRQVDMRAGGYIDSNQRTKKQNLQNPPHKKEEAILPRKNYPCGSSTLVFLGGSLRFTGWRETMILGPQTRHTSRNRARRQDLAATKKKNAKT